MKTLLSLLLTTGIAFGQSPPKTPNWDSLAKTIPGDRMPNVRPSTSFYRTNEDPNNVARATLDNLPVRKADSSVRYNMPRYRQQPYLSTPQHLSTPQLPVLPLPGLLLPSGPPGPHR